MKNKLQLGLCIYIRFQRNCYTFPGTPKLFLYFKKTSKWTFLSKVTVKRYVLYNMGIVAEGKMGWVEGSKFCVNLFAQ